MDIKEIVLRLREKPLFRYFDPDALGMLVKAGVIHEYGEHDVIIREGDLSSDLFVIVDGSVNVTVSENEKEVFICTIGEGEIFGEAGIFSKVKRTANVVSGVKSVLLLIGRESLLSFITQNPQTGIKILMVMVFSLLKKLREVNQELAFERKYDINQDDIDSIIKNIMEEVPSKS